MASFKTFKASSVRPSTSAFGDVRAGRYPWVLLASVVAWIVVGIVLITSRIGQPTTTIDDPTTAAVQGANGGQIAPTAQDQWFVPILPWLGVLLVLVAVVLFLGHSWARMPVAALGIVAVIGLASEGLVWQAVVAAIFVVVGAVCCLLVPAHRYLNGGAGSSASPEAPSTDHEAHDGQDEAATGRMSS